MSKRLLLVLLVLVAAAGLAMAASPTLSIVVSQVEADDMDWNTWAKNPSDFPVLQAAEKALGFTFKIESNNDYGSLLLPRIAAKVNLPDIFVMGGGFDIVKLATDGVIIPLGDLIAKNAPETVALWKAFPDIKHDTIAPDGNIYGYAGGVQPYLNRLNQLGITYRADWAKKLGIAEPMTIADWYAMLTAFKNKDPNGNGKKDEIAYSARYGNTLNAFAGAYGLSAFNEWWSIAADGKTVQYDWSSAASKDNAKAYLTEMNKWYKEGLIPAEFGSDLGDKMDALGLTNMVGADMHWTLYAPETNKAMEKDFPGTNWVVAFPPKGPTGLIGSEQYGPVNNERWMVTTTAQQRKTDVMAVKFLNFWLATETGRDLRNWGVEGISYYVDANGKKQYTNKATKSRYGNISSYLASIGSSRWPSFVTVEPMMAQNPDVPKDYWDRLAAIDNGKMIKRSFYFGSLVSTKAESDTISKYRNDINTYVSEMYAKFILGTEPLSNYDAFVAQLKKLGIDELLKIKQQQFDRFNK